VTEETLIEELCDRSSGLCVARHILCIQDTAEMNFYSQRFRIKEDSGLGRLDGAKPTLGFKMHSSLIIDADSGSILGFSDVHLWHRPLDMPIRTERRYRSLPIENKESYKWICAANKSKERLSQASMITFIEDREGDIYEQLSSISDSSNNIHYVIRSKSNRNTTEGGKVWDILKQQKAAGKYTLKLCTDHRKKRFKQDIELSIRYSKVDITKGSHTKNAYLYPSIVSLKAIEAYDEGNSGISLELLTTHKIESYEDALKIVGWYADRWLIEQVHILLKHKGFQIEDSELENGWAIRKLCVLMLSATLRIFQMNLAYSEPEGGQPVTDVFTEPEITCLKHINKQMEGTTHKLQNNNDMTNLKWATWIVARLGGWKGYNSQGPLGIIVLKRGLDRFCNIFYGWQLAQDVGTP
jgi:hypothetical protein